MVQRNLIQPRVLKHSTSNRSTFTSPFCNNPGEAICPGWEDGYVLRDHWRTRVLSTWSLCHFSSSKCCLCPAGRRQLTTPLYSSVWNAKSIEGSQLSLQGTWQGICSHFFNSHHTGQNLVPKTHWRPGIWRLWFSAKRKNRKMYIGKQLLACKTSDLT